MADVRLLYLSSSGASLSAIASGDVALLDSVQPNASTAFALNQHNANSILAITADGDVTLKSGNPGTGNGRTLTLAGLDGVSLANGGDVVVTAGNAVGVIARTGGDITFEPGAGAAGGASGGFIVNTVSSVAALTVAGATGDVTIANDATIDGSLIVNEGADAAGDHRVEGESLTHMIFTDASAATENIALLAAAAPNFQTMDRGLFIGNVTTAPTGNPTSGGFFYIEAGVLKFRGPSGTITTIAAA